MIIRRPAVAGKFYVGESAKLHRDVQEFLQLGEGEKNPSENPWAVMLPHAGHVYCGEIIGKTLAGWQIPDQVIILCPNHTGIGRPFGVWAQGAWYTPLGVTAIDENLARDLIDTNTGYEPDMNSHGREHSIEVLLPFLQELNPEIRIVPVSVGVRNRSLLQEAGKGLAAVLKANPGVGVIISSDMNHYESHQETLDKDQLALDKILEIDPDGLLEIVNKEDISMCGAGPMAIALYAARELGRSGVKITGHTTSAPVSGDFIHTVGYAGVQLFA